MKFRTISLNAKNGTPAIFLNVSYTLEDNKIINGGCYISSFNSHQWQKKQVTLEWIANEYIGIIQNKIVSILNKSDLRFTDISKKGTIEVHKKDFLKFIHEQRVSKISLLKKIDGHTNDEYYQANIILTNGNRTIFKNIILK